MFTRLPPALIYALAILAFVAGCVSVPLAPGAAAVVITRDPAAVSSCSPVGNVALDGQQQRTDPVGQIRNQAVGLGGNVVLDTTRSIQEAWGTGPSTGVIYRCPDTNHATSGS
jgi:hypothetical protein